MQEQTAHYLYHSKMDEELSIVMSNNERLLLITV